MLKYLLRPFTFISFCLSFFSFHTAFAQEEMRITLDRKAVKFTELIKYIEKETPYTFFYRSDLPVRANPFDCLLKDASISDLIAVGVKGQIFNAKLIGKTVVLQSDSAFVMNKGVLNQAVLDQLSTSSIGSVSARDINQNRTGGLLDNTNINGMTIIKDGSGKSTVTIRGENSLNSGTQPLVLIDGMPFSGDIDKIDRSNLESVKVLKDGDATAIYGSRGGNGVILITSKKAGLPMSSPGFPKGSVSVKKGFVYFDGLSGYEVLDYLIKEFKAKVSFRKEVPVGTFSGKIPLGISFDALMEILSAAGIRPVVK